MIFPVSPFGVLQAAILFAGYLALDWISYLHPLHGLNITPWNPAPALGLVFLLRYGKWAALPLFAAVVTADLLLREQPLPLFHVLPLASALSLGYLAISEVLRRRLGGDTLFADRDGLVRWSLIVAVGLLVNSTLFAGLLAISGYLPGAEIGDAILRHWVGDTVGALVSMPLVWMLSEERGRFLLRRTLLRRESLVYIVLTGLTLWIAFGLGSSADFKYLYFLFLPIVWAAARQGLTGAVLAATLVQAGIIASVQILDVPSVTVVETQTLALALAMVGFFLGVVVDGEQRVSAELRQTMRLAAAGEMAGALAHELNQPITALLAYNSACESLIERGDFGDQLRDIIRRMNAESVRAAEVVRRLRDFFRTGATQLERTRIDRLIHGVLASFARRAASQQVILAVGPIDDAVVMVDPLQIEVVLRNLLSNAFDAVADRPVGARRVQVTAVVEAGSRLLVSVEDSGEGIGSSLAGRLFEPYHTSKTSGLGLGLAISRAIVETHGGQLWAEVGDSGLFRMSLPIEQEDNHAA